MQSGIYMITNMVNNKRYIGSAIDLNKRQLVHFSKLRSNTHTNLHLQNACNKYNIGVFKWEILEYCDCDKLIEREQWYLDTYKPEYNLSPTAGSQLGYRHSKEIRLAFSENRKGKKHSIETRRKMSISKIGRIDPNRKLSNEDIINIKCSFLTLKELSKLYGVNTKTIWKIKNGLTYKEV